MTNNKSFLRFADLTGESYILHTINDDLRENEGKLENGYASLSENDKETVFRECRSNIWYFFREIVRIPSPFDDDTTYPFYLTPEAFMLIKCYEAKQSTIILKHHVMPAGLTTTWMLLALYEATFYPVEVERTTQRIINLLTDSCQAKLMSIMMTDTTLFSDMPKEREIAYNFGKIFFANEIFQIFITDTIIHEKTIYDKVYTIPGGSEFFNPSDYVKNGAYFLDITSEYYMQRLNMNVQSLLSKYVTNSNSFILGITECSNHSLTTEDMVKDNLLFTNFHRASKRLSTSHHDDIHDFLNKLNEQIGNILVIE